MARRTLRVAAVAALVIMAGCTGGFGGDSNGSDPAGTATTPEVGDLGSETGTVTFYVSDEPNAIEDFEHLNVTISAVGLHRVDGGPDDGTATPDDGTATPDNGTATPDDGTATPDDGTATPGDSAAAGNDTDTPTPTPETATPTPDEEDDEDGEDEEDGEDGEDGDGEDGDGEWVEYEVNATVDLTELVGANASKLDVLEAPAGTYDKVFVYVEEIDATLENGESVNVKLPSEKLHINKQFEVGNGEAVEFVFDIAVHKAGKSGKYILKPVVSQSGTGDEVDIDDVDEDEKEDEEEDEADDEREDDADDDGEDDGENEDDESDAGSLQVEFVGPVEPGSEATVKVTGEEGPVAGATVEVDGEVVGETGKDGTVTFEVPADAETVEVTVRKGDAEAELEREFEDGQPALAPAAA